MMRRVGMVAAALVAGAGWSFAQGTPAGDDRYRFAAGRGEERAVSLEVGPGEARFTWKASPGWDTALLGVKVLSGNEDVGVKVPPEGPFVEIAAGGSRLRAILMTSGAMIAGMLPMALALGEAGQQNAPLGRAVIGGLVAATFATLLVLPSVFALVQARASAASVSLDPSDPNSPNFQSAEA